MKGISRQVSGVAIVDAVAGGDISLGARSSAGYCYADQFAVGSCRRIAHQLNGIGVISSVAAFNGRTGRRRLAANAFVDTPIIATGSIRL